VTLNPNQAKKTKQNKVIKLDSKNENPSAPKVLDPDELIFSLDIGTRTVVGIVGIQENEKFRILAAEVIEHKNRSMLDGQIHDISQVAAIAGEVKEKLEKDIGIPLNKVAIAAAGRVLRTCSMKLEREIEQGLEIDREIVSSIEMEAIQRAQLKLDEEVSQDEKSQFYCVGYSVINYYLNGYVISSLIGHRGTKIGVEILATFLPHIVVDSLYTVMNKIGLEVISLTLEPIAASNVTIPKDLRLLNLALVDIGAGTSDIAITKDGSVIAYSMVPVAGDEITEKIVQHYLVDFNTGERIKISLSSGKEEIKFVDIIGKKYSEKICDILENIKPSIELLAETISQKILEYNGKAPNAVFLIGGGSQISGLTQLIAGHLGIPKDRVVVRGREIIQNIKYSGRKLSGPEAITPIGIAVTAQMQRGQDFLSVTLNGKKIKLFNSRKLTVSDALILIGFNPNQLIGRTGKSISYELNGTIKLVRGEHGRPAEIQVNDKLANLETLLNPGDVITVNPAVNGRDASLRLREVVGDTTSLKVVLNGNIIDIGTKVYLNGKSIGDDCEISNGDSIRVVNINNVRDLADSFDIFLEDNDIYVNGVPVDNDYIFKASDSIEVKKRIPGVFKEQVQETDKNDTTIGEHDSEAAGKHYEESSSGVRVIINGKPVLLDKSKPQYIFVDMFNYIDFDLSKPQGSICLKLNGRQAAFTDIIKPGDIIDIFWEK